jgi:hypothetical protein
MVLAVSLPALTTRRGYAENLTISGGVDGRYVAQSRDGAADGFELHGLFLNLRKVWSDEMGDRWMGVAQVDFDDNFERIRPYQVYLQYKGPLGKWNVRGGHYLLPFGLLATHDTERLVLQGIEEMSLGIRKDTGLMVLGHLSAWDYAASITDGLSDLRLFDSEASPVFTGRLAYVRNDWQVGFSTLIGRVMLDPDFGNGGGTVHERRFALDATKPIGRLTLRVEGIAGSDAGESVGGGNALADYALTSRLELNAQYAYWQNGADRQRTGLGLTYQLRRGLFLRIADVYEFGERDGHTATVQFYAEFSKQL